MGRDNEGNGLRPRANGSGFFGNSGSDFSIPRDDENSTLSAEFIVTPPKPDIAQSTAAESKSGIGFSTDVKDDAPTVSQVTTVETPTVTKESAQLPSEGVMAFVAPGVGELPELKGESAPVLPIDQVVKEEVQEVPEVIANNQSSPQVVESPLASDAEPIELAPLNFGGQKVAAIKEDFYKDPGAQAAARGRLEMGLDQPELVEVPEPLKSWEEITPTEQQVEAAKAAAKIEEAADSLDEVVARLQEILDQEQAEQQKGPNREHTVRSLLEVSTQGDRKIDSDFEATAHEILTDLENVTPEQLKALTDYANDYYSQLYLELGTAVTDLEKQEILAQISAAAEMYSQILGWRSELVATEEPTTEDSKQTEEPNPEYAGAVAAGQEIELFPKGGSIESVDQGKTEVAKAEEIEPEKSDKKEPATIKAEAEVKTNETSEEIIPEITLAETEGYQEIADVRDAYLRARAQRRNWFRRGDEKVLKYLEDEYSNKLNAFLIKAAEAGIDESITGEERVQSIIERATRLEVQEMLDRSKAEVALTNEKLSRRTLNRIKRHPGIRAIAGGLLLGGGFLMGSMGNVPLAVGFLAARSALNAVGTAVATEAGLDMAEGALGRKFGLRKKLTAEEMTALGGSEISERVSAILARSVRRGQAVEKMPESELLKNLTAERIRDLQMALALELRSGKSATEARANILASSLRRSLESERFGQERERRGAIGRWVVAGIAGSAAGVLTWQSGLHQIKPVGAHKAVGAVEHSVVEAPKPKLPEIYRTVADGNDGPEHMFRKALQNYATKHNIELTDSQLVRAGDIMGQKYLKPLGLNWKGHDLWVATGAQAEATEHSFHLISPDGMGGVFDKTVNFGLADAIEAVK